MQTIRTPSRICQVNMVMWARKQTALFWTNWREWSEFIREICGSSRHSAHLLPPAVHRSAENGSSQMFMFHSGMDSVFFLFLSNSNFTEFPSVQLIRLKIASNYCWCFIRQDERISLQFQNASDDLWTL